MARQNDPSFRATASREPKYRTSCDNCQAAKVKCGQGKPTCRRCSVHRLACVYSLSRRMGRPRAKRSAITAERCPPGVQSSARPSGNSNSNDNNNDNSNNNDDSNNNDNKNNNGNNNNNNGNSMNNHRESKPSTPAAPRQYTAHGTSETVVVAAAGRLTSPILEAWNSVESTALPDEQSQGLISWSPLSGGDFALVGGGLECSSAAEPMASFLPTDSPMDLDCVSRCLEMEMPSFLQDLPNSPASSHPPLAMPTVTPEDPNENAFASPPLDLLLQMPTPGCANNGKNPPSLASVRPHSLLRQGTRQEQHFGPDSDLLSCMTAESPRQSMAQTYAMDHMLDDPGFSLASGRADGSHNKTLSQGSTCFSQSPLLGCINPNVGRHGGAARRLSPPSTADAKLRRLSGIHGFRGFLDRRADAPAEEGGDNDVDVEDGEEEEEEEDEEEAFIPSSNSASSTSDLDEQTARMYGAGAGTGGHCGCVSAVSRCIVSLRSAEQQQRMGSPLPLDGALLLEGEVTTSLSRLDGCRTCRRESGAVHLLALVGVRMMVQLLQKTVHDQFASRRWQSESGPHVGAAAGGGSEGGGGGTLWIGKFRVMPRARLRFLRRLLQARFYRLAVLVGEREKLDHGLPSGDCFAGASSLLLADISQALRTVMGWLELWNSKPR